MGCLLKEYKLYPYQQEGLAFALKHHYCIIGDSMGLGKTIQAIEVMKSIPQVKALVVCPAFLKESWAREIKNFSTMTPYISKKGGLPPEDENIVVIIGYSQLKDADLLFQWADIVTADECHYLKNIDAKRTLYFHDYLQRHRPYRFIGLSGTAVKNRVPEWFSLLALCSLDIIGKPNLLSTVEKDIGFLLKTGLTHRTLSIVLTNSLISGYSRPVSAKTASTSGWTDLTKWRSTVESLPPEKAV